jgi:dTDP-4-dehydrorhamnose reductase
MDSSNQLNWGLCHYSNEGECSWYDFAKEISRLAGLKTKINAVSTSEYPSKAVRPSYSVMDKSLIKNWLEIDIPDWKDSLAKCIQEITNKQ